MTNINPTPHYTLAELIQYWSRHPQITEADVRAAWKEAALKFQQQAQGSKVEWMINATVGPAIGLAIAAGTTACGPLGSDAAVGTCTDVAHGIFSVLDITGVHMPTETAEAATAATLLVVPIAAFIASARDLVRGLGKAGQRQARVNDTQTLIRQADMDHGALAEQSGDQLVCTEAYALLYQKHMARPFVPSAA